MVHYDPCGCWGGLTRDEVLAAGSKEEVARKVRTFDSGATRDTDQGKLDYEGFLSPLVLWRFACYMHSHRKQPDGKLRAADNWKKGIPKEEYLRSLFRHFMDLWLIYCGYTVVDDNGTQGHPITIEEAACGIMFNAMGFLHVILTETTKR